MLEGKNNWKAWLYLAPALVLLGIFSFYPIVSSFVISFIRDYSPVAERFAIDRAANKAAGLSFFTLDNFKAVLKDKYFLPAIKNTLLIAFVSVPISVVLSLVISVLLVSIKKIRGFFQTLFFLPYVTSAMAVSMAFTVLFANNGNNVSKVSMGPVNTVIEAVGLKEPIMNALDKAYWNSTGKKNYQNYICVDKDGNVNFEDENLVKTYKSAKTVAEIFEGKTFYATIEEWYDAEYRNNPKTQEVKYGYEHHFRTLNYDSEKSGCTIYEYNDGYIDWVGTQSTWNTQIVVVLLYSIWAGMAFKILVFTGGLTGIDKQYYDAAKVDNTSKWRTFWKITVPMMSPLIVYILITSLIGSFKTYTSIVGIFGDKMGPQGDDYTMVTFVGMVYRYMNNGNDSIHIGAAAAVVLFLIILVVTEITNKFTRKRVHY